MLHGYVVVVKRTGVDGSKFPVTERTIKIGVTAGCHILINTPYVADEHCALTVKDNGQVWVKNLSKDHTTALNENNIETEALLNHGDILEIGGRLVRWEYLPESKYYYKVSLTSKQKTSPKLKGLSTPKSGYKATIARSPKTPGNTPKNQLIHKLIASKANTPKSVKQSSFTVNSTKKSNESPKAPKTTKTPQSIKASSPKVQKTPSNKTPKSTKVDSKSSKAKTPKANSSIKSGRKSGKALIKVKTPKTIRKSLFTSPKVSPKEKSNNNTPNKVNTPKIGKTSEKKTVQSGLTETTKGRFTPGHLNGTNMLQGRKSIQATKRLFSAADVARRKSDAISKLNDDELLELANLNYRKKLSEEKCSSVKRQGTPLKRLSYSEKRVSRHRSSMLVSAMSTIIEPSGSNQTSATKLKSPLKTPCTTSADQDTRAKQLKTPVTKRNSSLPMIIFSSEKKSPLKRLSLEPKSPTKITAKDLLQLMVLSNQTPPEVVTPEKSPAKTKRNDKQSPLTPLYRVMTIGIIEETPPEVVTPRSSMSSTKSCNSLARLRTSLPNSPVVSQKPIIPERKSSPLKSGLLSPTSPRKSALKSDNSTRSSPRGGKESLNNSSGSPKVSFNIESPTEEKNTSLFSPKILEPVRTSGRGHSVTPIKSIQSPVSGKSSPVKGMTPVTPTRSSPVKTSPQKDAFQFDSVSLHDEIQPQSPLKRSSLRNSSPANASFKSAHSSLGTPKTPTIVKKKAGIQTRKRAKLSSQPDKTKKKALLVLGKASQKKTEILMKQKLLKRAIKLTNRKPRKEVKIKNKDLPEIRITSPSQVDKSPHKGKIATPDKLTSPKAVSIESQSLISSGSFGSVLKELTFPNITSPNYARRSSKRISAMNEVDRPDFTELSPSALGLTPRLVEPIRTSNEKKRRSTSLTTPRAKRSPGIIKAVSTSKKSSKTKENDSTNSSFNFQTPDISQEIFVSPLTTPGVKSKNTPVSLRKRISSRGHLFNSSQDLISFFTPQKDSTKVDFVKINRLSTHVEDAKSTDLIKNPTSHASVKNTLSAKAKSPNNDLRHVEGIKRIFSKSPRNDLRRVGGVKKLLKTPQQKKVGVKRPAPKKQIKSPKNDLSNPLGVKKLFAVRKVQNSPKNDLSYVAGVKTLFKPQKSPKNRLSDFRGMKKILSSPKVQKEPENCYVDLRGVKELLGSPKVQKSPRNRLSDFKGVKQLLGSPLTQNSPSNDLTNVKGIRKLFASPKPTSSPKNDLRTVIGVKELFEVESPKSVSRKVRGSATPVTRPTRSKLSIEVKNIEHDGESDILPTKLRVRQKTLSSPKSDSSLKAIVLEPDTSTTPLRRGRPKRTATVAPDIVAPPKSRRGAVSKVRDSEPTSSSETAVKQGSKDRLLRAAKAQSSPKTLSPPRRTRARGKTQPDPVSSPTPTKKVGPKGKTQLVTSSAKQVSPKTLRSRTQTTDSVSSPITKVVRTRGKAQPSSPASSPKRKTRVAKTTIATTEKTVTRTRSTRTQSANPVKKNESSKKTESSNKRGKKA